MEQLKGIKKPFAETRIDWLTLVYNTKHGGTDEFESIMESLMVYNSFHWTECRPVNHYNVCYYLAGASIIIGEKLDDNKEVVECMIQFSGTGLAMYANMLNDHHLSVVGMLKKQFETYNVSVSRIDVATDFYNYNYHYSPLYLYQQAKYEHNLITQSRTVRFVDSFPSEGVSYACDDFKTKASSLNEGTTLYIGKNPKQLRIYNKKAERQAKLGAIADCYSWYRWEYQLNGERADDFISVLQKQDYDLAVSWLLYLSFDVRFIEQVGHQEKRSRYPNATWFDKLVQPVSKLGNREDMIVKNSDNYSYPTMYATLNWVNKGGVMRRFEAMIELRKRQYLRTVSDEKDAEEMAVIYVFNQMRNVYYSYPGKDKKNESLIDLWKQNKETLDSAIKQFDETSDEMIY